MNGQNFINPILVGENIKKIRKSNNLSQIAFAEKLFRNEKTVRRWEKGEFITLENINLICQTFDIQNRDILFDLIE